MVDRPLRFLHSSDLRLDAPLSGAVQLAASVRELFRDAPLRAAEHLFDRAIDERVDFIVLAGAVLDLQSASPSDLYFLIEQFHRLDRAGIATYWAGSELDSPQLWPDELPLPARVKRFAPRRVECVTHFGADGQPLARLLGSSAPVQTLWPMWGALTLGDGLPTIGVAHCRLEHAPPIPSVDYWALGGRHQSLSFEHDGPLAHYPGSPQGRSADEPGPHGATLVEWTGRSPRLKPMICEAAQWCPISVTLDTSPTQADLKRLLAERLQTLAKQTSTATLLVTWQITVTRPLADAARSGALAADLLAWLRTESAHREPAVWHHSLSIEHDFLSGRKLDNDTVVGQYLQAIDRLALQNALPAELDDDLALVGACDWVDLSPRTILREAARLGLELLTDEEPRS